MALKLIAKSILKNHRSTYFLGFLLIYFKNNPYSENVPYFWTSGRLCDFDGCDRADFFPKNINGWFWSANQEHTHTHENKNRRSRLNHSHKSTHIHKNTQNTKNTTLTHTHIHTYPEHTDNIS